MSYEERLEAALSNASQREKEKMHIVENYDNLKRIYKELLAYEEKKLETEMEETGREIEKEKEHSELRKKAKKSPLCRYKEKCKFLPNCRFGHPEARSLETISREDNMEQKVADNQVRKIESIKQNKKENSTQEYRNVSWEPQQQKKPSKQCLNGPECEFRMYSHCWFYHPEDHVETYQQQEKGNRFEDQPIKINQNNPTIPCFGVRDNRTTTKNWEKGMQHWEKGYFEDWHNKKDQNNPPRPFSGVLDNQTTSKNWKMGMQQTMHSLEKRLEKRMEMQINKLSQEIKRIQKGQI